MQEKARYRIKVSGCLDSRWANWFDDMRIAHRRMTDGSAFTLMESGEIDQAALYGTLERLRNLNLTLVGLERIDEFSQAK